jgi:dipeptidase D
MEKRVLNELEPKIVWNIFEDITKVPRPSKKEEKIRKWIKDWAKKYNISFEEDTIGNIILTKKAMPGCEDYPVLVLQAHMDMVCQKTPETKIDFENDPLKIKIVDDYVTAKGTTLGADDGIGMAYGMAALISEDIKHGPLEVVLTVDEETGLTGAFKMEKGFFSGKYLLNVDSETLGEITIGSAGGGDTHYSLPVNYEEKEEWKGIRLSINGLKGGHSGIDIHLPRLNAIKVVIEGVLSLKDKMNTLISSINGGSVHNAIPRESVCELLVPKEKRDEAVKILEEWKIKTLTEKQKNEPNMKITISRTSENKVLTKKRSDSICNLLYEIPHGAISFSKEIEGLVQTSNNLAVVKSSEDKIDIFLSGRSSVDRELKELRKKLKTLGEKYGADVIQENAYPGWQADPGSPFLALVKNSYEDILKNEVSIKAIHGGLECGLFSNLNPELQIASIGPEIKNVHTPNERVYIKSVGTVWDVIRKIIENMGTLG